MFSARKPTIVPAAAQTEPTPQILALIARMRALSLADKELARLIDELGPYLPRDQAAADERLSCGVARS